MMIAPFFLIALTVQNYETLRHLIKFFEILLTNVFVVMVNHRFQLLAVQFQVLPGAKFNNLGAHYTKRTNSDVGFFYIVAIITLS